MKVCVVGPVYTSNYFGGVSTFVEGLADGFKKNGHEAYIITDYTERAKTIGNVEIISLFKKDSRKNITMPRRLANKILDINPDLIVTSLEYGLVNNIINKKNNNIKTIHYLHAFPSVKRSKINNFFVNKVTKKICDKTNYVISNSTLTSVINSEIFNINSHEIINVGIGYDFLYKINDHGKKLLECNKKNILFAGRLVKEKNVDLLIKSFAKLKRTDVVLNILGDGNEKENLEKLANSVSSNIVFHGKVSPIEMPNYFKNADVFVSLNPHEPYGIVYLEALCSNTAIVCPKTGGQMDTLVDYKDRVRFINPYDIDDIASKLDESLNINIDKLTQEHIDENFSYKTIAGKIENLYYAKII